MDQAAAGDERAIPDRIPGFVDLQINGWGGVDFSSENLARADCARAFDAIRRTGTAAFLPTVITGPAARLSRGLATLAAARGELADATAVPGIHLEGPFLDPTPGAIGAHDPQWVRSPDPRLFDELQEAAAGKIRLLTVAAGLPGVGELIAHAVRAGVIVAIGHSMGGYEAVRQATDAGATMLTHLGNGMPHEVGRHENPLLAGLAEERLTAGIITDGHHLPADLARLILRVKGAGRTVIVSDAAPVAGLAPGRHSNLGNDVELTAAGLVVIPTTRYLAGSGLSLTECADRAVSRLGFSAADVVSGAFANPAELLGIDPASLDGPGLQFDPATGVFVPV